MRDKKLRNTLLYLLFVILAFILLAVTGCTKTVYIPVQSTKTEYRDIFQRDSIHLYDSIYIKERVKGDTVYIAEYQYRYLYRDKIVRDSITINDTIRVPMPVDRPLSKWQQTKMDVGGWAIGAASGLLFIGAIALVIWIRKKM